VELPRGRRACEQERRPRNRRSLLPLPAVFQPAEKHQTSDQGTEARVRKKNPTQLLGIRWIILKGDRDGNDHPAEGQ